MQVAGGRSTPGFVIRELALAGSGAAKVAAKTARKVPAVRLVWMSCCSAPPALWPVPVYGCGTGLAAQLVPLYGCGTRPMVRLAAVADPPGAPSAAVETSRAGLTGRLGPVLAPLTSVRLIPESASLLIG